MAAHTGAWHMQFVYAGISLSALTIIKQVPYNIICTVKTVHNNTIGSTVLYCYKQVGVHSAHFVQRPVKQFPKCVLL